MKQVAVYENSIDARTMLAASLRVQSSGFDAMSNEYQCRQHVFGALIITTKESLEPDGWFDPCALLSHSTHDAQKRGAVPCLRD